MYFLLPLRFALLLLVILLLSSACTLPLPTVQEAVTVRDELALDRFAEGLTTALAQHDYVQLQELMGPTFVIAGWRAEGSAMPAEVATVQLRNHYLPVGSTVATPADVDWTTLLGGKDPLTLWGAGVQAVKAIYVTGLGNDQQAEAVFIIAQQPDGAPYWHGMLIAPGGFHAKSIMVDQRVATAAETAMTITSLTTADPAVELADALPRLQLNADAPSATVQGIVQPQASKEYRVHLLVGQQLAVNVASPSGRATFTISGVMDGQPQQVLAEMTHDWMGAVPATQDYLITVNASIATAFQLRTTLDAQAVAVAPQPAPVRLVFPADTDTTTITEQIAAPARQRYLVRAVAGQTLYIAITSPDDAVNFALQGVTDGLPLKRLENQERSWSGALPLTQDYLITVATSGAAVEYIVDLVIQ